MVRAKPSLQFKAVKWVRKLPKNILSDCTGVLTVYNSEKKYPELIRKVSYFEQEKQREYTYLTNALHLTAYQVAELYKNRWQIELFFKWLKQHLKIQKFGSSSQNAVRIQIYAAITAYCLVAIVQHDMKLERSTYEILQILSISLTDTSTPKDLFNKANFKNIKERIDYSELNLFNF